MPELDNDEILQSSSRNHRHHAIRPTIGHRQGHQGAASNHCYWSWRRGSKGLREEALLQANKYCWPPRLLGLYTKQTSFVDTSLDWLNRILIPIETCGSSMSWVLGANHQVHPCKHMNPITYLLNLSESRPAEGAWGLCSLKMVFG